MANKIDLTDKAGPGGKKDILRWKGYHDDRLYTGPSVVYLHLTNFCNFKCRFCWYHSKDCKEGIKEKKSIDRAVFEKIILDCRSMNTMSVLFSGEGEPLLHPQINSLIESVYKTGMGLMINTNGALIGNISPLVLRHVSNLNINISEVGNRAYLSMQSGRNKSFDKIIESCRYITLIREKYSKPRLGIVFIINRHNLRHMSNALDLAVALKADSLRFKLASVNKDTKHIAVTRPFLNDLKYETMMLLKTRKSRVLKTNIVSFADSLLKAKFFDECEDVYFKYGYFRSFYFEKYFKPGSRCPYGWFFALIDIRGNVFLCCNHQQFIVGNVLKDSFVDIWNSKTAQQVRLKMKYDFNIKDKLWRECHYCGRDGFFNPAEGLHD